MNQSILLLIIVAGLLLPNISEQLSKRESQLAFDSAQAVFTQLALAQYRRSSEFIDPANPILGLKGYASNPGVLKADGYLPVWNDSFGYWSFSFSSGGELTINFDAGSVYSATQISRRMGEVAKVSGTVVSVGYSDVAELAMLDTFIKKQGDTMQGPLFFDAGIGMAVNLGHNTIENAATINFGNQPGNGIELRNKNISGLGTLSGSTVDTALGEFNVLYSDTSYLKNISLVETIEANKGVGRIQAKSVVAETVLTSDLTWVE